MRIALILLAIGCCASHEVIAAGPAAPPAVTRWLTDQIWQRDTASPVIQLGAAGEFDDTHLFAPCVAMEEGRYRLWYCGSQGTVAERVFKVGLAESRDGKEFVKHRGGPVYEFGDGQHSVLTPSLLRDTGGAPLREQGKLRLWFSATHFAGGPLHTLHETSSADGIAWSTPSPAQLNNVYAPSVLKLADEYLLWYVEVGRTPWVIRHARSRDGRSWQVHSEPVLVVDQAWEKDRLFYPHVVQAEGVFLMWYGSYWSQQANKTALGFAVSEDGVKWHKHPANPVLRPDPKRDWESHYTTSHCVLRQADGSWRIWYASRKRPPFENKYFAIGTARWDGIPRK